MITKEQLEQFGQLIHDVNPEKHYWFFRTMGGLLYDEFVSKGFIAIGYDVILMRDLQNLPDRDDMARAFLKARLHEINKEMTDSQISVAAGQIIKFFRELSVGDIIVAPNQQSKKFAIGVIESEMFEDSGKHDERECQFVKRRRVRWEKEVWRHELDPKAILAFGNQQTMSSIDEYAEFIDRKINRLYNKGDKTYLALRVNQDKGLTWDDFCFISDLGELFEYVSKESGLGIDLTEIQMTINVQSPGDIILMCNASIGVNLLLVLLALGVLLPGGEISFLGMKYKTEGFGNFFKQLSETVNNFLDHRQDRKDKIVERARNMKIDQVQEKTEAISPIESEAKALPSSRSESEDDSEHDEQPQQ
jgi:hypothetical protein